MTASHGGDRAALMCTALGFEARVVRRACRRAGARDVRELPGVAVIGMRARHLDDVSAHHGCVMLLGFGGGLDPAQQPGDVVVATEVRDHHSSVRLPAAAGALEALVRAGIPASAGPLWCSDHIVRGSERLHLRGRSKTPVVAVDMESGRVANACDPRALVVVRVLVDTPSKGLVRASLFGGRRAKRTLARVAEALTKELPPTGTEWITSGTVEEAAQGTSRTGAAAAAGTHR